MELRRFFILVLVVILMTVGLVLLFMPKPAPIPAGAQTIPYQFSIGDGPGIDAGTDIFRLGQVAPGGTSWRTLTIEPTITSMTSDNLSVRHARVYAQGRGASWLVIDPSSLELPGTVKISLIASSSAEHGIYKGVLVVVPYLKE